MKTQGWSICGVAQRRKLFQEKNRRNCNHFTSDLESSQISINDRREKQWPKHLENTRNIKRSKAMTNKQTLNSERSFKLSRLLLLFIMVDVSLVWCQISHGQLLLSDIDGSATDQRYTIITTGTDSSDFLSNSPSFGADFRSFLNPDPVISADCTESGNVSQFSYFHSTSLIAQGSASSYARCVDGSGPGGVESGESQLDWLFYANEDVYYQFQCSSTGSGFVEATFADGGVYLSGNPYYSYPTGGTGNIPQTFSFTGPSCGISAGCDSSGSDGSWSFSLLISAKPVKARYSQAQKAAFIQNAKYWSQGGAVSQQTATAILPVALAANQSGPYGVLLAQVLRALALGLYTGGAADNLISELYSSLALDPPDTNYSVIAPPTPVVFTPINSGTNLTQTAADAFNAWLTNQCQAVAYSQAISTCINRAQGAADATNSYWETAQMNAAEQYEAQLAGYLDQEPTLRSNLVTQLVASGFPTITVTSDEVTSNQMNVFSAGFDTNFQAVLTQFGVDGATITNIEDDFVTQDPNSIAGTFPQSLVNPTLDAASHNVASVFRESSLIFINVASLPGGQIRFDLPTEPGYNYTIQCNHDLNNPSGWTTLLATNATTALLSFTNAPPSGTQAGFYRALQN